MPLTLIDERREELSWRLEVHPAEELDPRLSVLGHGRTLEFVVRAVGGRAYDRVVDDARRFVPTNLDGLGPKPPGTAGVRVDG